MHMIDEICMCNQTQFYETMVVFSDFLLYIGSQILQAKTFLQICSIFIESSLLAFVNTASFPRFRVNVLYWARFTRASLPD